MLLDKQYQIQKKELEKLKLQAQIQEQLIRDNELERERELERARERERETEKELERAHEITMLQLKKGMSQDQFNISSAMKLVPQFDEKNVAEFFIAFEKIASKLQWPEVMWTTLVQSRLTGKAQKVYVSLKDDISSDYSSVREIILKSYKLVPEAYRQKFRDLKKFPNQTFVEFARVKEQLMNEWLMSKEVSTYDELKELMLIEEFKSCCTRELKLHLEELKLTSLQENAIASDEYALSHRNIMYQNRWRNRREYGRGNSIEIDGNVDESNKDDSVSVVIEESPSQGKSKRSPRGSPRGSPTRYGKEKRSPKGSPTRYGKMICYFCQKPGHVRSNCYAFRRMMEQQQKPIGLLVSNC